MSEAVTINDAICESLVAAARHAGTEIPPIAVLWTDDKAEWLPVIGALQDRLPQLLVYGEYDLEKRMGPSIWIKCAVERQLPDVPIPEDVVPIVYFPNVSRQTLRAGDECPLELQPLVELLYRGTVWTQKSGRDWTVEAMLVSKEKPGFGLDVAGDRNTKLSMIAALTVLADTPISKLTGKRLEGENFDELMIGDHPRDLPPLDE